MVSFMVIPRWVSRCASHQSPNEDGFGQRFPEKPPLFCNHLLANKLRNRGSSENRRRGFSERTEIGASCSCFFARQTLDEKKRLRGSRAQHLVSESFVLNSHAPPNLLV